MLQELIVTPVTPQIEEKSLNKVAEAAAAARLAQGLRALCAACPGNMDGTEGSLLRKKPPLCRAACHCLRVPVVLWDERRTTVTAAGILFGQQHLWRRPQSSAGFGFRRSDL